MIDYAAALRECGFDDRAVASGLRLLEAERGTDFLTVVSMLRIQGHQASVREHEVEPILRRLAAEEVQAQILERGERASLHVAAAEAERAEQTRAAERRALELSEAMSWLIENMTDDEIEERVAFRPEIAEGWRRYLTLKARDGGMTPEIQEQLNALDTANRLRTTRPSPPTARPPATASRPSSVTESHRPELRVNGL